MPVKFEIYDSPVQSESEGKKKCHARVVGGMTVETEELASAISREASLTEADVYAAVIALTHQIERHLSDGRAVHVDGLGYFQLTLKTPDDCSHHTRAERVSVKSVAFRPDKKLRDNLSDVKLVRSEVKVHSSVVTTDEVDEKLLDFFQTNESITTRQFQDLVGMTPATANRRMRALLAEGKLVNRGSRYNPHYVPGEAMKKG